MILRAEMPTVSRLTAMYVCCTKIKEHVQSIKHVSIPFDSQSIHIPDSTFIRDTVTVLSVASAALGGESGVTAHRSHRGVAFEPTYVPTSGRRRVRCVVWHSHDT
jgi:hypothetical protein